LLKIIHKNINDEKNKNRLGSIVKEQKLDEKHNVSLKRLANRLTELKKQYNYQLQKRKK